MAHKVLSDISSLAFAGTFRPLTDKQRDAIATIFNLATNVTRVHHGSCSGGDTMFHDIAREYGQKIEAHPTFPEGDRGRAVLDCARTHPLSDLIERNNRMVKASDLIIVCPHENAQSSGTDKIWGFVAFLRGKRKPLALVFPDGRVKYEYIQR